ncbi:MAG: ribosomal protein S18-alanine N-acetyltransferase [Dehalococcoidia bacterium]
MATVAQDRILIRPMLEADLKQVRRIERAAYGSSLPGTPFERELRNGLAGYLVAVQPPTTTDGRPAEHHTLFDSLRRLFAHDPEPRVLGFLGVWYTVDQLHVVTVAVDPAEQGRGIAQRLLLECHRLAAEAELPTIALEVRVSNDRARSLYRWFGFTEAGTLRRYYSDNGEDALVMLTPRLDDPVFTAHVEGLRAALLDRFDDWRPGAPDPTGG